MKSKEPIILPVLTWDSEEKSLKEGGGGNYYSFGNFRHKSIIHSNLEGGLGPKN